MTARRNCIAGIALVLVLLGIGVVLVPRLLPPRPTPASASLHREGGDHRLKVVATFSILGDLAAHVGGEHVALTTLVGPGGDTHAYEPSPADVRAVASADVVIVNGLGFEGWIDRLIEASGYRGPVVIASRGVVPLHSGDGHAHVHGPDEHLHAPDATTFDPHAWQSVANVHRYVANIATAFSTADADNAAAYAADAARYHSELDALERDIAGELGALPADRRIVVTSHDAFGYFGHAYGLEFLAPQGLSTQAEPSARDVAALIALIRERHVAAVFLESIADPRLLRRIAAETGAGIGGTLYSDALSPPDGPAPTYVALMRHNASELAAALGGTAPPGAPRTSARGQYPEGRTRPAYCSAGKCNVASGANDSALRLTRRSGA